MHTLKSLAVAVLLLGFAVCGSRISAGKPVVATPEFRKAEQVWPRNLNTVSAAFADLDGDGDLDGVFASMISPSLVLLNDGRGRFAASPQVLPSAMHDIAIGDVDGNGDKDLFFAPIRAGGAPLFLNDGRGRFVQAPLVIAEREERVVLIDLDHDGDPDAYFPVSQRLYANDGRGRFDRREPLGFSPVGFCDLNGDRVVDAVSRTHVHLNDGRGRFTQSSAIPNGGPDSVFWVAFADVDRDGDSDVIALHAGRPSTVLLNDGAGVLRDSGQQLPPRVFADWGFVAAGDLTGDGAPDLVITHRRDPAQVWVNDGKGTFTDSGVRLGDGADNTWMNCVLMDFDADGDLDVFISNRLSGQHGLWFNQLAERRRRPGARATEGTGGRMLVPSRRMR